ncbi:NLR family CARD domain-containing protein 3-like isoform X2 [Takifugu rubripes]|uniref:NLR family CARD domain-containing protein 3-like isoform X2 n=1 Tax=Takifugu rubripes TaxID=31033 RepID=UPI00114605B1|nr:NLR family CARD domain-containing protein 3-like isoform X2 [Takifugu rubripes]
MEGLADLREKPCGDVGSTNRAEVQWFSPSLSAQGGSVLVAPSITGSSIGSVNITITSPDPGLISSKEALNNNNGEVALQPPDRTAECRQKLKAAIRRRFSHLLEGVTIDARKTPLRQIYTELYITEGGSGEVNKEHEVRQIEASPRVDARDKCISCNQLFVPAEGQDFQIRSVMTRGVAGVGKTVHVNKFTLDWAEDGEHDHLDFVFPLSFRELNLMRKKSLSFEELLAVFFPETKESGIFKSVFIRILFILDGLDESRLSLDFHNSEILTDVTQEAPVAVLLTNLIRARLLPLALVWITSRPLASARIPLCHLDLVTEVRGFNDPQKDEYFRRKIPEKPLAERVIAHVKSCRSLHIMCHLPIFCLMAATVLRRKLSTADGEDSPKTLTQMYIHFLSLYVDVNKRLPASSESKADVLRANLMSLGNLAYRQLEQGNLIFYEKDLVQSGIQVTQASVFSGVYTEIFSEEMILCREKMFCFIHLSIQEFFAALYVFLKFNNDNFNVLIRKPSPSRRFPFRDTSELVLYRGAVDKALRSEEGHFDIFLRFLLGLSLESNQTLLEHLMIQNRTQQRTRAEIIKHIKEKIRRSSSVDRCLNLFHCLNELNDRSLVDEIQSHLRSGHLHQSKLSSSQWNTLVVVLLVSEEDLGVFVLSQYARSEEGLLRLLPVVKAAQEAKLNACKLTVNCCEKLSNAISTSRLRELDLSNNPLADAGVATLSRGLINANLETLRLRSCSLTQDSSRPLASTISSGSCRLRLLDLSDNDLRDAGVQRLCGGLESPDCKLETLLLSLCGLTHQSCTFLASALNSSGLRELDLSYNHPGDAGLDLLSTLLHDPQCSLRVEHCGEARILPAPQKYTTKLTLDPNTAQVDLCLSEGNSTARRWTQQPYPDHLDRFDFWSQVLSVEGLTGRCYWETKWSQRVFIGAAYRSMRRKGEGADSWLGKNESSWGVSCHPDGFRAWHKGLSSALNGHPGSRKVGVFLDWCAGTLAFFTVADGALSLLHTFNTTFTEPVHAAFRLGWGDATVHLC